MVQIKYWLILVFLFFLPAAGCTPEEPEPLDEGRLEAIDEYAIEMSEALLDLLPDLEGWVRIPYSDNMPLVYDQERIEWLLEHGQKIERIRNRYFDGSFPTYIEIREWDIIVVRGEREWQFDGEEVSAALEQFDGAVAEAMDLIELIERNDGELDMPASERVLSLLEAVEPAVEELRYALFRIE